MITLNPFLFLTKFPFMYVKTSYLRGCYCVFCIKANVSRQLVARRKGRSIASSLYFRQPRSQGLSSSRPLERERERDPGMVWSRASQNLGRSKEKNCGRGC